MELIIMIDESNRIDIIAKNPQGIIEIIAFDTRKWNEIPNAKNLLQEKFRTYKRFAESESFINQYSTKKYKFVLIYPEKPSEEINAVLKKFKVLWKQSPDQPKFF